MRIGVSLPQREPGLGRDISAITEYARAAEAMGYDHIRTGEHVLGANAASRPGWQGPYTHNDLWHEPFVLFGYLAGLTKTLEFVTSIVILPQRQTALVAKQAAALDLLSGERLWTSDQMTVQARWGAAFMVKNGDRFFVNNDAGFLMIAQFTPEGYVEIDRTRLIEPTTSVGYGARRSFDRAVNWSHPAYANRHIIARNDHEIVRASLAKE